MGLRHLIELRCASCGRAHEPSRARCEACSDGGALEAVYDLDEVARTLDRASLERREPWMWRYRELLPLDELAELPRLQVGMTPVYGAPRLAAWAGLDGLWIKDEGRNPARTFEDRASALAVVLARESGRRVLAWGGQGAAGASAACFAASEGLSSAVFVPEKAPRGELLDRVATALIGVGGGPAEARGACLEASGRYRWFARHRGAAPLLTEGDKTLGLEIADQLGARMPDWIAFDASRGASLRALWRGLEQMKRLGIAAQVPRLLAAAVHGRDDEGPLAPGASEAVRATNGALVLVDAADAARAASEAGRKTGVLADAASGAVLAALRKAVVEGVVARSDTALAVVLAAEPAAAVEAPPPLRAAGLEDELRRRGLVK